MEVLIRYGRKQGICYATRCECALGKHLYAALCEYGRFEEYHQQRGATVLRWPTPKQLNPTLEEVVL